MSASFNDYALPPDEVGQIKWRYDDLNRPTLSAVIAKILEDLNTLKEGRWEDYCQELIEKVGKCSSFDELALLNEEFCKKLSTTEARRDLHYYLKYEYLHEAGLMT